MEILGGLCSTQLNVAVWKCRAGIDETSDFSREARDLDFCREYSDVSNVIKFSFLEVRHGPTT